MKPLFAILLIGNKLITIVQPNYRPHQLHPSDLHLILNFVNFQPGLCTNELWFPICLPRFHSAAFLYAYTICFDPEDTKLSLVLISSFNTTEQFEFFRILAMRIRRELGLPEKKRRSIMRIYGEKEEITNALLDDEDDSDDDGDDDGDGDDEEKEKSAAVGDETKKEEGNDDSLEAAAALAVKELGLEDDDESDNNKDQNNNENNVESKEDKKIKSIHDNDKKECHDTKKSDSNDVAWKRDDETKEKEEENNDDDDVEQHDDDCDEITDKEIADILQDEDDNGKNNTMQYKKPDSTTTTASSNDNKSISSGTTTDDENNDVISSITSVASSISKSTAATAATTPSLQRSALAMALKEALAPKIQEQVIQKYKEIASALHFVFRCDVVVVNSNKSSSRGSFGGGGGGEKKDHHTHHMVGSSANNGVLTQCLSPPLGFPFVDTKSKRRVWNAYQRLSLRLRLGSASFESTMDAFDMIIDDSGNNDVAGDNGGNEGEQHNPNNGGGNSSSSNSGLGGIGRDCPAQCLMESPPNVHGVTYALDGTELFIALNGKDFELYATLPGTIPPRNGSALCARLVRRLMNDERKLFLANPPTWRN